ncbi:AIPR family protein [Nonomuraea sp. KM90]|uniref:AIPR family protein n=1 Tax=Nonomuraea sp. KM90 TaxID=3457428 RepID=UPI003FCE5F01
MLDEKTLRHSCEHYAAKYGHRITELERGLKCYAAHLYAQEAGYDAVLDGEPAAEADLGEYICQPNDLGIDVVLEDEINRRILLVQAAWRSKRVLEEDRLSSFFDVPARLRSPDYIRASDAQIQDLLSGFKEKEDDGYEICLRFVTNLRVGDKNRLLEVVEAKNQFYETNDRLIICELVGLAELAKHTDELDPAIDGGFVETVRLNLQKDKFIELTDPYRTIVAAIKANELVDLYRRRGVGNRLFNLNIRMPLGSKKVNSKIVETAVDPQESSHFFYYNNGVSAVCSSYSLDGTKLTANRFQIINGAQTVSALVKARATAANTDVYVLFRLTETTQEYGGSLTENIIRFNNTQNPVKASDFYANDDIQVWLSYNLAKLSGKGPIPAFYYAHKSGHKPKGATGRGLKIEQFAGIRHCFLYGPIISYREPQQFFDRQQRYWEAFGIDGKEAKTWTSEHLACGATAIAIHHRIQDLGRKLRTDERTKASDEARYLYRLARYVTGLTAEGLREVKDGGFETYRDLISSSANFDKWVEPIIGAARRILRYEWKQLVAARGGVQIEYNLARDEKMWGRLSASVREEVLHLEF